MGLLTLTPNLSPPINLTGNCFIKADTLNGSLFHDILYLSHCVKVGKGKGPRRGGPEGGRELAGGTEYQYQFHVLNRPA